MQSTLFTELSATEEANLSGGFVKVKKPFKKKKFFKNKGFSKKQTANGGIVITGDNVASGTNSFINKSAHGGGTVITGDNVASGTNSFINISADD